MNPGDDVIAEIKSQASAYRFSHFRRERVKQLRTEWRTLGGGTTPLNMVGGLLDLIYEAKPRSVIEIGSHMGVSTECFLLHCQRVVSIDSFEGSWSPYFLVYSERLEHYPNLDFVFGNSPEALEQFSPGEFDLCYIDGNHDYSFVVDDIRACQRIVKPGGWMAGHDCVPDSQVERAVRELLGEPKVFSDTSWLIRRD